MRADACCRGAIHRVPTRAICRATGAPHRTRDGIRPAQAQDLKDLLSHRTAPAHYDHHYFEWQHEIGRFGAKADMIKFRPFIKADDRVIDFGCGGGFMLRELGNPEMIGVEINPAAVRCARSLGIETVTSTESIDDGWADIVISNHALEHVEHPLREVQLLRQKLRLGGVAVFCVPCDRANYPFRTEDPDFHLYSWSASNLGNLFTCAGFEVLEAREYLHRWPARSMRWVGSIGWRALHAVAFLYALLDRSRSQVRVVARKVSA